MTKVIMTEKGYIPVEKIEKYYGKVLNTKYIEYVDDYAISFKTALLAAMSYSTTDVAPVKHGHWDNISESCSVCGSHWAEDMVMSADDWFYFDPMPAYCPYCGSKMDEGDDKE